jgi:hypothetical protein
MRNWHLRVLVGLGCLALAGCAERAAPVSPPEALSLLRTGRPLLSCREACLDEWRRSQTQAAQLDAAAHWPDLAVLVLRIGYQDDLSLYYLGRAAEGMGYLGAAVSYYQQSTLLAGTSISCEHLSRLCGGVALPNAASFRLAAVEREQRRRTTQPTRLPATPGIVPGEPGTMPNEAAATAPNDLRKPPTSAAGTGASEYIEPPPAGR